MRKILETLLTQFLSLLLHLVIGGVTMWIFGLIVCEVFNLDYPWTILHGLVAVLFYDLAVDIFRGKSIRG